MNNLQLTDAGRQVRDLLQKLNDALHHKIDRPLVEPIVFDPRDTFQIGWDMGIHYARMYTLRQAVSDALTLGLPRGPLPEVAS